jgi:hypothetical protein
MLPLLSIFTTLEGFTADLYPHRYIVTPLLVAAGAAAFLVAVKLGAHRLLWRHRLATAVIGTPLLVVALVVGDYLFSPLWERSFFEEASPITAAAVAGNSDAIVQTVMGSASEPGATARVTAQGAFRGADAFHFGRGDAQIIQTPEGGHVLRFEDFSVRNGPDLYVYLSRDETGRRVEEPLNLGRLRATDGAFNYDVPAGIELSEIKSVVVWCRQFTTLFAHAPLTAN